MLKRVLVWTGRVAFPVEHAKDETRGRLANGYVVYVQLRGLGDSLVCLERWRDEVWMTVGVEAAEQGWLDRILRAALE